jgi:hypothetical protein
MRRDIADHNRTGVDHCVATDSGRSQDNRSRADIGAILQDDVAPLPREAISALEAEFGEFCVPVISMTLWPKKQYLSISTRPLLVFTKRS